MAQAIFNSARLIGWEAISAGTKPSKGIKDKYIKSMKKINIDLTDSSTYYPKHVKDIKNLDKIEKVIVMGRDVDTGVFPKGLRIDENWDLPDPADMFLDEVRDLRNVIEKKVMKLIRD